jgi:sec-independent protein translocase protein TatB
MIDFGFDKIALIGAVALIVIGPEKLPRVARTVGHFVGKAQRYVADVKAEVNRTIELEELQKMKKEFETTVKDVQTTVTTEINSAKGEFESQWKSAQSSYNGMGNDDPLLNAPLTEPSGTHDGAHDGMGHGGMSYAAPRKNWRLKRAAMPRWYKQRHGVRAQALSGAARVAKHRPKRLTP